MIIRTNTNLSDPQMVEVPLTTRPAAQRARAYIDLAPAADRAAGANVWGVLSLVGTAAFMMPRVNCNFDYRIAPHRPNRGNFVARCFADDDWRLP
jgi:hypothetical protein